MKILFVNSVLNYGSTGKIVQGLKKNLESNGHHVAVIYGRNEQVNESDSLFIGSKLSLYSHYMFSLLLGRHALHSSKMTKKAIQYIDEFNPDIIHLHNLHGYYLNVPMFLDYLSSRKHTKIIWTLHDAWLISGSSAYFDFYGIKSHYKKGIECNNTMDYPKNLLGLRQKNNIEWKINKINSLNNLTFVSPSEWLANTFKNSFLEDKNYRVINNGIDTQLFSSDDIKKENKTIIGVANIWEKRKGLADFIKLREILDDSYRITLVGLNKKQIEALPGGIVGIERTENAAQLAELYSKAMYYVNPTYEDNYPTTNLESLSCGTQVLAYDTGGNKEVSSLPYVKIFPKGDITQIAEYIKANNPYPDFTTFDKTKLSIDFFTKNTLKLYEEMIDEN